MADAQRRPLKLSVNLPDKLKLQIIVVLALAVSFLSGYTAAYRYHRLERRRVQTAVEPTAPAQEEFNKEAQGPFIVSSSEPAAPPPVLDIEKAQTASDTQSLLPRHILFTCVDYRAKEVLLAGDFIKGDPLKMKKEKPGVWRATVDILPGTYRYHYLINGKKTRDRYNPRHEGNDSILAVEPRK